MKRVFKNPKLRSELERSLPEFVWEDDQEAIALRGLVFYRLQLFRGKYSILRQVQSPQQLKRRRQFLNRLGAIFEGLSRVLKEGYGFQELRGLTVPEVVRRRVEEKFDSHPRFQQYRCS